MEETYRKLESEMDTVRHIILVFLGAGVNFTIGYPLIVSGMTALVQSTVESLESSLPQTTVLLIVGYFAIGIIYSTSASLAFHPKRIISPLYVQTITALFVPILMMYIFSTVSFNPPIDFATGTGIAFVVFLFSLLVFGAAGIGQTRVMKALIGLNGTKENINSFGLMISGKVKDVLKVLRDDSVREALSITAREDRKAGERSYLFRTSRDARQQLFVSVIEDPDDSEKTQLAAVSYSQTYYGIKKLGHLAEEQTKRTIESALKEAGFSFSDDNTDSRAKSIASSYGLLVTESRLLSLKSLPPHSKAIIIGLSLMIGIVTLVWKSGYMTLEMYETFVTFAGFSVLIDVLPLLRTKRRKSEPD